MPVHRHRSAGIPIGRVLALVVALHVVVGGGALWVAKTQSGREFARVYHIKLFEPPKQEQAKEEPPPPPPPPKRELAPPPSVVAPKIASNAPSSTPQVSISGGGGGPNWGGGKFQSGLGEGPMAGFHGAVAGRIRKCNPPAPEQFNPVEVEFAFTRTGIVKSFRLVRSSGNRATDDGVLRAAACVQSSGPFELPEAKPLVVTVKMTPL